MCGGYRCRRSEPGLVRRWLRIMDYQPAKLVSGFVVIAGKRSRSFVSRGMSLISALGRSTLSPSNPLASSPVARNTAHTGTSPAAMKNYLAFVEKERHQSHRMMKRNEDHPPLPPVSNSRAPFALARQHSRHDFRIFVVRLSPGRLKLSECGGN